MQRTHWDALPDASLVFFNSGVGPIPERRVTFVTRQKGMLWHVPKALGAHYQIVGMLSPGTISQGYRCQEKLNGAYVCWDGAQLWSKTGGIIQPPDSFVQHLPPGFPLVGELYVGNGHRERSFAATLAQGKTPTVDLLGLSAVGLDPRVIWKHARVVAFDVPGIVDDWPYAARHHLLCAVIDSWSQRINSRLYQGAPNELPLQVIIQYPMRDLPALFLEIVHGTPYHERRHPAFGIPTLRDRRRLDTLTWRTAVTPFPDMEVGVPGEGCMLWNQEKPWQSRGHSGSTTAILKFKPLFLSTAIVGKEGVEHSRHRMAVDGHMDHEEDNLPGYHVQLHTHVSGEIQTIKAFVSASHKIETLREKFRVGSRVFFVFFMFERMPMYPRALGPILDIRQAHDVQRWQRQFEVLLTILCSRSSPRRDDGEDGMEQP